GGLVPQGEGWRQGCARQGYRRGMYTHFQRTSPYPMLMTFDAPDSNVCVVRRERSNTPLQALTLLNDAAFFECAQGLAQRMIAEAAESQSSDAAIADRIRHGFRLCLSRDPSSAELDRLQRLYEAVLINLQAQPEAARQLAGTIKVKNVTAPEAACWTILARTLLNLDEFVTRE
ncbi:MAG: DUF1553 domain-containing protein, partial [Pirellulales bacterium]